MLCETSRLSKRLHFILDNIVTHHLISCTTRLKLAVFVDLTCSTLWPATSYSNVGYEVIGNGGLDNRGSYAGGLRVRGV